MNISGKKHNLIMYGYLVSVACGLGVIATRADAQNAGDDDLGNRVMTALHTDPYLNDRHVTVSVEKGSVVLGGFVFSGWQVQDALRDARKAAGNTRVVDDLDIHLGGR
jgi:osmotically-inducible protein OsmY